MNCVQLQINQRYRHVTLWAVISILPPEWNFCNGAAGKVKVWRLGHWTLTLNVLVFLTSCNLIHFWSWQPSMAYSN